MHNVSQRANGAAHHHPVPKGGGNFAKTQAAEAPSLNRAGISTWAKEVVNVIRRPAIATETSAAYSTCPDRPCPNSELAVPAISREAG